MAFTPKDMTGVLFKNDRREKETHPEYTGSILIDGVSYWLSAWVKQSDKGKFFSLAVKAKDGGKGAGKPTPQQEARRQTGGISDFAADKENDFDDSIPF